MEARERFMRQHQGSLGFNRNARTKPVKNFARANRQQLRSMERRNAQRRAEEEWRAAQPRRVPEEFAHVESKLYQTKENIAPANKKKTNFLRRSDRNVPPPPRTYVSQKVKRKPRVTAAAELRSARVHAQPRKNFVESNRRESATRASRRNSKAREEKDKTERAAKKARAKQRSNYGRVPKYLQDRKREMAAEAERLRQEKEANKHKGMVKMPEEDRLKVLKALDEKLDAAHRELARLPLVVETPILRMKKTELEEKISEIIKAQHKFSNPNIWIRH